MTSVPAVASPRHLDFSALPSSIRTIVEAERLSFGHQANPAFAVETSRIDPLPHQRIAVYERMLGQPRLRFLLADDAGAGKTIMAGLYIREMLSRRMIHRVLIVPPAGLVGNWEQELRKLFSLSFTIVRGSDSIGGNPFIGDGSDQLIVSIDTLRGEKTFARLAAPEVEPYDLVIFDEAHKLSADLEMDGRFRRTDRYKLAEALAGVPTDDARWRLPWSSQHLLLLTATPHMGKDYPYYCLWRLLEPELLVTEEAFKEYPEDARRRHFIRRIKEEMCYLDGEKMFPPRTSDTFSYKLSPLEQKLYDETTQYITDWYNKAKVLNRAAAEMVKSVFQRRLASSAYALMRSFERRAAKLQILASDIRAGRLDETKLKNLQQNLELENYFLSTADEEGTVDGREQAELIDDDLVGVALSASATDVDSEVFVVSRLRDLAQQVYEDCSEAKFDKLWGVLSDPAYNNQKAIIFTEHRDTLTFLMERLGQRGFTDRLAIIHGGLDYKEREKQIDFFRTPAADGGAQYLICTDAAGEGINLQFCWLMVNYDIPWNPARLEQRMGRIHRYGQKHDVFIANLIAGETREGKVMETLLRKLEIIRNQLKSDKVYDVIGRLFSGKSLRDYLELALSGDPDEAARQLDGMLTADQVRAIEERQAKIYHEGDDIQRELPRLRLELQQEERQRVLPGFVRGFIEQAAELLGIAIEGDMGGYFYFRARRTTAMVPFEPVLETYAPEARERMTLCRPSPNKKAIFMHPGEPVFELLRALVQNNYVDDALHGAVFTDPSTDAPYFLHFATIAAVRRSAPDHVRFGREETIECRLAAIRRDANGALSECPAGLLLLLSPAADLGGTYLPANYISYSLKGGESMQAALDFAREHIAQRLADGYRSRMLAELPERLDLMRRGFMLRVAELAKQRTAVRDKALKGDKGAGIRLSEIKLEQDRIGERRDASLAALELEPELIAPGPVEFIAHALVVPTTDPVQREHYDKQVEEIAMRWAKDFETGLGAHVSDVSSEAGWRAEGFTDWPGFDLLSRRPDGSELCIEVKGRAAVGKVHVSGNEWARACILKDQYWLYTVYNCVGQPVLRRVCDPFNALLAKEIGGVLIDASSIIECAEQD